MESSGSNFVDMITFKKGDGSNYRPVAGETCLISPPHCDNEDGFVYEEFEVLWADDIFLLYRLPGCRPTLDRFEHLRCKPIIDDKSIMPEE